MQDLCSGELKKTPVHRKEIVVNHINVIYMMTVVYIVHFTLAKIIMAIM